MRRLLCPALLTAALALGATAPAQASTTRENGISPTTNAGFVMTPPDVRSVSAAWTVPTVSCTTPDAAVRFAVELADAQGAQHLTLGIDVDCRAGVPSYAAWLSAGRGRARLLTVAAGDEMSAGLRAGPKGVTGTLADYTAGRFDVLLIDFVLSPTQAGVVVSRRFGASGLRPLADFGTFEVTSSRVNHRPITKPVARLQMRSPGNGGPQVRVSNLVRPAGSFTATWLR